ncbi:MAG: HAD hydrolase-like protein [Clostridiales bacterium]|nr:HAD hydrolase-like protein [Clostridiales bacterium]
MYKYLLFDLDGTITKSEEGIFNCIKYALDWAGIPYPEYSVFRSFIGPSLYDSFVREFGMGDAQAKEMVAKYRERYNVVGLFEAEVYDGVADTLSMLKEKGCILSVATSKPTEPTLRILEKFGVRNYFDVVVGSNPDGTGSDKKNIISQVLESLKKDHGLTEDMIDENQVVMIGDRRYDIEGGKACGLQTIGVLYGYGSREEFETAGADHIVETPNDILELSEK